MPAATESPDGPRPVLGSAGNRVRVKGEQRQKKVPAAEKATKVIPLSLEKSFAVSSVRRNVSAESSFESSSSSSSGSIVKSGKSIASQRAKNNNDRAKSEKSVLDDEALIASPAVPIPVKRCDWITPNSEPLYTCFHDEEWGVPVHDDAKLFELLVLSVALAELSWPDILSKRPTFRKLFDDFVPMSVANLDVDRMFSTRMNESSLLSEPKLRAVVENARQVLKIQQDFGSFENYCWRFVNQKPIKSGFRYARQVPAKTPKSELMSKDMMRRGFRCVGPTVIYSFMQASGIVNDHFVSCFRYNKCSKLTAPSGHKST